jgi:hypothetical protein
MGIIPILPTLFTVHPQPRPMGCSLGKKPSEAPSRSFARPQVTRRLSISELTLPVGSLSLPAPEGMDQRGNNAWFCNLRQWSNLFKTPVFVSSQILFESSKMQTMCCFDPLNLSNDLLYPNWYAYLYETSKSYTVNQPSKAKLTSPIISMNCSDLAT